MQLHQPDPAYIHSRKAAINFSLALRVAVMVTAFVWFAWLTNEYLDLGLQRYGLKPRDPGGLIGIFTAPFLHGSFEHLFANTAPLVVSLTAILYLYPNCAVRTIPMVWLGSGLLTWCVGRPSIHIGASGFVYGILAFVFVGGVLRRDLRSVGVSLMVWFLYGSMIWGVLPVKPETSWEMHLSGTILGVMMAVLYRSWDRVPIKRYTWEDDDSVPDWFPEPGCDDVDAEGDREDLP